MRVALPLLLAVLLAGCAESQTREARAIPTPGPEAHLLPLIGNDAINCGSYRRQSMRTQGGLTPEELKSASDCATDAHRKGKAFYLYMGGTGIDSYVARGIAGARNTSDLYRFSYDSAPCGGPSRSPGCGPNFGMGRCDAAPAEGLIDVERLCRVELKRVERPKTPVARVPGKPAPCEFTGLELPDDYAVLGSGAYSGRTLGFQIDQSGHEATQMDVLVNYTSKPVVLMLGAYEPTIWNISWSEGTRIAGVLASGYHRQVIAGIDKDVPTLISSYDNKGACGYFYMAGDGLQKVNPLSRQLFHKEVEMVYPATKGSAVVGAALPAGAKVQSSSSKPPESYRDNTAPIAGLAGLEDAEKKGLLRKATDADAQDWADAVARSTPRRDVPPVAGDKTAGRPRVSMFRAYVVLQPFTFPSGLFGGNSATFFIPQGVPRPQGNPGHSSVYDFNQLKCAGPLCGR